MKGKQTIRPSYWASLAVLFSLLALSWQTSASAIEDNISLDYSTDRSRVTEVRHQGVCNSSWAYAAVATLEGQQAGLNLLDTNGRAIPLSVQMLFDCSGLGCHENIDDPTKPFDYARIYGVATDYSYPERMAGECKRVAGPMMKFPFMSKSIGAPTNEWLKEKLNKFGPIMVGIDVNMLQNNGIAKCVSSGHVNHYVTLVGYGSDRKGNKYYKYKNSYGKGWGNKGYGFIERSERCVGFGNAVDLF